MDIRMNERIGKKKDKKGKSVFQVLLRKSVVSRTSSVLVSRGAHKSASAEVDLTLVNIPSDGVLKKKISTWPSQLG